MDFRKIATFMLLIFLISFNARADIQDYRDYLRSPSHSEYGTIGLINMPSARTMPAGSLAFHWTRAQPYFRGSIIGYPFDWLEALYKYTDINDRPYSPYTSFSGGQSLKDKAFDVKFVLLKESRNLPQVAFGIRDLGGTNRFAAEYLVASKYIGNFDVTIGAGWGTLSSTRNSITNPFTKIGDNFKIRGNSGERAQGGSLSPDAWVSGENISIFGGAEYFFSQIPRLRMKLEYDTTRYSTDQSGNRISPEGERPLPQESPVNFSFIFTPTKNLKFHLGRIRGNTLQVGFTYSGSYGGKDPLKIKNDKVKEIPRSKIIKQVNSTDDRLLYLTALKYLAENEIYLQSAEVEDDSLHVAYAQRKHQSYVRGAGRVSRILNEISPDKITTFKLSSMNADAIMHTIEVPRNQFVSSMKDEDFESVRFLSNVYQANEKFDELEFIPRANFPEHTYAFTPALRSHVGGPDGFYFGEAYLRGNSMLMFSRDLSLTTSVGMSLFDNFDDLKLPSDSVLPHVRTDIVDYLKGGRGFTIGRMQLDYIKNPIKNVYAKLSGGLFEEMFGGVGGEVLYRPFDQDFAIGMEAYYVKQRDYQQKFDFLDYDIVTGHINTYYLHTPSNVLATIRGGRFLAGDSGITIDFSRRYKSGLYMGAFFSLTDISSAEFGEGSFDKGFYFSFPLEIFLNSYAKGRTYFGLKPLTRDGAAYLIKGLSLYGVTDQSNYYSIERDWDDLYD